MWARGCPVGTICTGHFTSHSATYYRRPFKRLHFAGTEHASEFTGFMEGGIAVLYFYLLNTKLLKVDKELHPKF